LKDTSRQLTAAFDLIHHADPSSSPSMVIQLYSYIHHNRHRPTHLQPATSLQFTRVRFNAPFTTPIRRLPNTSLIWLAGGTVGGPVGWWNFLWYRLQQDMN